MNDLPLAKRDWYISPKMFSELMDLKARYGEFGDDFRFIAEVMSRFGLQAFTEYRIIVEYYESSFKGAREDAL